VKATVRFLLVLGLLGLAGQSAARAAGVAPHLWTIPSPTHEQTFAYGSEWHRAWVSRGPEHHLALDLEFTNDPYVSNDEPRRYDDFTFDFPQVTRGADGRTFYYHPGRGRAIPVAAYRSGFLGIDELKLLPHQALAICAPHGFLSLTLFVSDR